MPEYSPHELDKLRLERDINEILERDKRDKRAYRERTAEEKAWLMQEKPINIKSFKKQPKPVKAKTATPETRGSKPKVKRGHYKKHENFYGDAAMEECPMCLKRKPYCRCQP